MKWQLTFYDTLKTRKNYFNSTVKRTTNKASNLRNIVLTDFEESLRKMQTGLWDFI
jgi:hypothetical protein